MVLLAVKKKSAKEKSTNIQFKFIYLDIYTYKCAEIKVQKYFIMPDMAGVICFTVMEYVSCYRLS